MKKIICLSLCFVAVISIYGQQGKSRDKDFFNSKVAFGILIGIGKSSFKIKETNWKQTSLKDTFNSINTVRGQIISLGNEIKLKLNNSLAYRQRMLLSFESTKLKFDTKKNGVQNLNIQNMVIALPIHLMLQSNSNSKRPFVFLGSTPKFNLGKDKEINDKFQIKAFDLTADFGIGIEIKFKKFLIAPELIFSQGLLNVNNNLETSYSQTISKLTRQNLCFGIIIR